MDEFETSENVPAEKNSGFVRGILTGLIIGCLVCAAVGGLVFSGYRSKIIKNKSAFESEDMSDEATLDITNKRVADKLVEIEKVINAHYKGEIDEEKVEDYLYTGLVYGLGDAYADYFTVDEYASQLDSTNGAYFGIGAVFSQNMVTGIITVQKVYEGFSAFESGILPGDILYAVEDEPVTGTDLTEVVTKIKGEENTKVHLSFIREGEEDYVEVDVKRVPVEVPTVTSEMLEDHIGYIAIDTFDMITAEQFEDALNDLEASGMEGLIIDLRNNGGGRVAACCEMADLLLPEGLIVYTEDKFGNRQESYSDAAHSFNQPLVLLVNSASASASEIFAGAIKDYGIGKIVGTTTFGKGIVQNVFTLSDGTALKLTIADYYTPNGTNIHGVGIEPDVEVELNEEVRKMAVLEHKDDNQLQTAMDEIRKMLK